MNELDLTDTLKAILDTETINTTARQISDVSAAEMPAQLGRYVREILGQLAQGLRVEAGTDENGNASYQTGSWLDAANWISQSLCETNECLSRLPTIATIGPNYPDHYQAICACGEWSSDVEHGPSGRGKTLVITAWRDHTLDG